MKPSRMRSVESVLRSIVLAQGKLLQIAAAGDWSESRNRRIDDLFDELEAAEEQRRQLRTLATK